MKASIYLRKTKKGTDDTTLCIRIRQGKSDLRAVTPLTVITQFWDCRKQCYKSNTPVTTGKSSVSCPLKPSDSAPLC